MGKKTGKSTLKNYRVFRRPRSRTIRALNNIHVVNTLTINALVDLRNQLRSQDEHNLNFEIPVVSGDRIVIPKRKTKILQLLDHAIEHDLYKQSLISAIAVTEDYLAQILTIIFKWFPHKLKISVSGIQAEKKVDLDAILEAQDLDALLLRIIEKQLVSIFYESPARYFEYLERVLSFELQEETKGSFAETKATRDILVHNMGVANEVYLRKARAKARASQGKPIPLDSQYFSESIRCMKSLTVDVFSKCLDKYREV